MLRHQYRGDGWHRIVKLDAMGFLATAGEWVSYQNIAVHTIGDVRTFIAVTDYFSGSALPVETIMEVSRLPKELDGGSEEVRLTPDQRRTTIEIIQVLAETIRELCKIKQKQGLPGLPSGEFYAHLMAFGISHASYESFLDQLKKAGVIKVVNNCIIYQERKAS